MRSISGCNRQGDIAAGGAAWTGSAAISAATGAAATARNSEWQRYASAGTAATGSCMGVLEFRCDEVAKQSAPAAADANGVEAAAPAPAPACVTVAAGTPRSIQELTASNGDVDTQH